MKMQVTSLLAAAMLVSLATTACPGGDMKSCMVMCNELMKGKDSFGDCADTCVADCTLVRSSRRSLQQMAPMQGKSQCLATQVMEIQAWKQIVDDFMASCQCGGGGSVPSSVPSQAVDPVVWAPPIYRYTRTIETVVLPHDGVYRIKVMGASGGDMVYSGVQGTGGSGANMAADFSLLEGDILELLVGGSGLADKGSEPRDSGGGGGSFISINGRNNPLIVAGGGGGSCPGCASNQYDNDGYDASTTQQDNSPYGTSVLSQGGGSMDGNGSGGGGYFSDGAGGEQGGQCAGGTGFTDTPASGWALVNVHSQCSKETGGFGGGANDSYYEGGGGGGYTGGFGGCNVCGGGGGGGSFVKMGATNVQEAVGNRGNGAIEISFLGPAGPAPQGARMEYTYTETIETITISDAGRYRFVVKGASGGDMVFSGIQGTGGSGAIMESDFTLAGGDVLEILVGGEGKADVTSATNARDAGGGGGSFVSINGRSNPLIVAGGGGGSCPGCHTKAANGVQYDYDNNGSDASMSEQDNSPYGTSPISKGGGSMDMNGTGGGGYFSDGASGQSDDCPGGTGFVQTPTTGWALSTSHNECELVTAGFGGGGNDSYWEGGGGGGYTGAYGGCNVCGGGGGGGSFIHSPKGSNTQKSVGNRGNGSVTITFLGP